MVHLGPLRKIKTKSAVVLTLAVTLFFYTLHSTRVNMLNDARNAVVLFTNNIGTSNLQKQRTPSDDGAWQSFNSTNTSLPAFSNQTATNSSAVRRRMISVELVGSARLGNLMCGHASMLGMADKTSLDPIVSDKNRLLLDSFDLGTAHKTLQVSEWSTVEEKSACTYDESLIGKISQSDRNVLLFGYFQSWRYFDHIRLRIIKEFQFKSQTRDSASKFIETATLKHYPSSRENRTLRNSILRIGIHVRRGDLLASTSVFKGFTVADAGYVSRAMAYLEKRLNNTHAYLMYIVASDDLNWCRKNIVSTTHPIEFSAGNNEAVVDLAILASCNHTIATVGTFSWWAGYLAGGITVYYKNFPANGSETASLFRAKDFFPPTWIGL